MASIRLTGMPLCLRCRPEQRLQLGIAGDALGPGYRQGFAHDAEGLRLDHEIRAAPRRSGGNIVPRHSDSGNPVSRSKKIRTRSLTEGQQAK